MPTNKRKPVTPEYSPGEYLPEIFIDSNVLKVESAPGRTPRAMFFKSNERLALDNSALVRRTLNPLLHQ